MELLLLLKLKWDIMVPTSKDFLIVLLKKLEMQIGFKKEEIKNHANTFIDLIILGKTYRSEQKGTLKGLEAGQVIFWFLFLYFDVGIDDPLLPTLLKF